MEGELIEDYWKVKDEEVLEEIRTVKRGKATGHDNITGEMLKNMGDSELKFLIKLFNKNLNDKAIPQNWEMGVILPVYKKGECMKHCLNKN